MILYKATLRFGLGSGTDSMLAYQQKVPNLVSKRFPMESDVGNINGRISLPADLISGSIPFWLLLRARYLSWYSFCFPRSLL